MKQGQDFEEAKASVVLQVFEEKDLEDSLHAHVGFELVHIVNGAGEWVIGDNIGTFSRGSLVLCPPRVLHAWTSVRDPRGGKSVSGVILRFRKRCLPRNLLKLAEMSAVRRLIGEAEAGLIFEVPDPDRLRLRLRSIDRTQGALRLARLYVALDLVASYRRRQVAGGEDIARNSGARPTARFAAARRFIEEHFREEIGRAAVAKQVGMDEAAFSRFFRQASGSTFVDYLSNVRVREAATMLGNRRDLSIAEVAKRSGFRNLGSFHRQFKKRLGTTPIAYRKAANLETLEP